MKVAFINPHKINENIASASPPLNLGILANYIRKHRPDVEVKIIDGLAGQDILKSVEEFKPDLIAITSTTPTILDAYEIADILKKEYIVIMGGVHPTCMPEEALQHCNYVVVGEGELAIIDIIDKLQKNETIEKIINGSYIKNLDDVPAPAWDLIDMDFYLKSNDNTAKTISYAPQGSKAITIVTSRGCPFRCSFCYNSWRSTPVRYHSAQRVVEDIENLMKNYGINAIFFGDDEFIMNKDRFLEIARLFKEKNIKLHWGCQARADTILRYGTEFLNLMKESGCTLVAIGCESGNQRILKILKNDTTTVEQNRDAIALAKKSGLKVSGSFMIGVPSETKEEMMDTFNFFMNSDLDSGGIGIATPYPKTGLWDMASERGLLPEKMDYIRFLPNEDPDKAVIICDTMPRKEFIEFFNKISRQVGEKVYYKKIHDSDFSIIDVVRRSIKKRPLYVISYPIRHPIKALKLIFKL